MTSIRQILFPGELGNAFIPDQSGYSVKASPIPITLYCQSSASRLAPSLLLYPLHLSVFVTVFKFALSEYLVLLS
jgi:hypothetical protein